MTAPTTPELSIRIIPGAKNAKQHSALPWRWVLYGIRGEVVAESPEYATLFDCSVYCKTFLYNFNNTVLVTNIDAKLEPRYGSTTNRVDDYFNTLYDEISRTRGLNVDKPKLGIIRGEG